MASNIVTSLQTAFFFAYGTYLLAEPGMICHSLVKTGLYVWFIITYILHAIALVTTLCAIAFLVILVMNVGAPEDASHEASTTPLTYQAEAPYKDV